jgi:ABC-type multidrug transport system ATPase subunit
MWDWVRSLSETGVTIILTTHYIEEAEMADRIGVINKGEIISGRAGADAQSRRKQLAPSSTAS